MIKRIIAAGMLLCIVGQEAQSADQKQGADRLTHKPENIFRRIELIGLDDVRLKAFEDHVGNNPSLIYERNDLQRLPLHYAIQTGHVGAVKILAPKNSRILVVPDIFKHTPLSLAVWMAADTNALYTTDNMHQIVEFLIDSTPVEDLQSHKIHTDDARDSNSELHCRLPGYMQMHYKKILTEQEKAKPEQKAGIAKLAVSYNELIQRLTQKISAEKVSGAARLRAQSAYFSAQADALEKTLLGEQKES